MPVPLTAVTAEPSPPSLASPPTPSLPARLFDFLASLVAPDACAACDGDVPPRTAFCAACVESDALRPQAFAVADVPAFTPGLYDGPLARAVKRLKYDGHSALARPLGRLLFHTLTAAHLPTRAVLVPVPLHPVRLAHRGYNQSALLAQSAGRLLGVPSRPRALARSKMTEQQAHLSREERQRNVENAFHLRQDVRGLSVIVVDDVVTTGATALACARVLAEGGARIVAVAALARAA